MQSLAGVRLSKLTHASVAQSEVPFLTCGTATGAAICSSSMRWMAQQQRQSIIICSVTRSNNNNNNNAQILNNYDLLSTSSQDEPKRQQKGLGRESSNSCSSSNWILTSCRSERIISRQPNSVTRKRTFQNSSHTRVNHF